MIAIGHAALLRPWWLLALPVVIGFYLASRPRGGSLGGWDKAADPHLLAAMVDRSVAAPSARPRASAVFVTLMLGIVALAGPAVQRGGLDRLRNLDATVIVLDVSQDMGDDNRIHEAAAAAHDLLGHLGGKQAALIVYAGDAYVASALTDFTGAIDADLFALDGDTVPDPGVRPDRALALAGSVLDEAHIIAGDVILIAAGGGLGGTGAIRAAAKLQADGHRVYAVDAAPPSQESRRTQALDAVAAAGGGFAVPMSQPARLVGALSNEAIRRVGNSAINSFDWRDLGRVVLVAAAIPLLWGFRKAAAA